MHDPMTVAHEVVLPFPKRKKWREGARSPRWALEVSRRTNPENLGERVYRWWRPAGYVLYVAGRAYGFYGLATIWHVEPGGRDSGTVCRHYLRQRDPEWPPTRLQKLSPFMKPLDDGEWYATTGWKWHVWHWRIQFIPGQRFRRWLLERCEHCGFRFPYGYSPVSHQWGGKERPAWWKLKTYKAGCYHWECSEAITRKRDAAMDHEAIQILVGQIATARNVDELDAIELICDEHRMSAAMVGTIGYPDVHRIQTRLRLACDYKYESDDNKWVKVYKTEVPT